MYQLLDDPFMLYSLVNMLLRDRYASLDELCDDFHIERAELETKLSAAGFEYSSDNNRFW